MHDLDISLQNLKYLEIIIKHQHCLGSQLLSEIVNAIKELNIRMHFFKLPDLCIVKILECQILKLLAFSNLLQARLGESAEATTKFWV